MTVQGDLHRLNSAPSPFLINDPGNAGAIACDRDRGIVSLVSTAAQTRTLVDPDTEGVELTIYMDTDGGDIVITAASAVNVAGNTSLTFNNTGDQITLKAITVGGSLRWSVIANDGVTLA